MRFDRRVVIGMWVVALTLAAMPAAAQNVSVTSAEPNVGEQETTGLQVRVKGRNFAPGAQAKFLLDDDTDGGIAVNSTTFVSSTEVIATVDISAGAALTFFDIRITNTSGRTGRGSDLFQVVEKGARGGSCVPGGQPAGFVEVARLNPAVGLVSPTNMAIDMEVVGTVVNGTNVLMAAASSGSRVEVYFLTAGGGGTVAVDAVNAHRTLVLSNTTRWVQSVAVGDVNADGTPDVVAADLEIAALFVGTRGAGDVIAFGPAIPLVAAGEPNVFYGRALAIGNLDPLVPGNEIVLTQTGSKGGKTGIFLPVAHVFSYSGGTITKLRSIRPTLSPAMTYDEGYAYSVALVDVTGTADLDLIATSRKRGQVWIFPGPSLDADGNAANGYQPIAVPGPSFQVGAGDVDGIAGAEIVATTGWSTDDIRGEVLRGLAIDPAYTLTPESVGLGKGWSTRGVVVGDFNGDTLPDVAVGAPNAEPTQACTNMGAAYVFLGQPGGGWRRLRLDPNEYDGSFNAYGWSMAFGTVDGLRVLLVGEQGADVGGVNLSGQVYVYRVDNP